MIEELEDSGDDAGMSRSQIIAEAGEDVDDDVVQEAEVAGERGHDGVEAGGGTPLNLLLNQHHHQNHQLQ